METIKIIEVPVEKEKPVEVVKWETIEKKIEVPVYVEKIKEVEVIKEVIKEVEKIVVKEEENCDCLSGVRFINAWNKLFKINGNVGSDCISEKQFISIIKNSLNTNAEVLLE